MPHVLQRAGAAGHLRARDDRQVATDKQQDLIRRVIESGHGSTIEHIVFTFAISGVTRTLSHQLVRHRAGVAFDQQSQRYLNYKRPVVHGPGLAGRRPREMRDRFVAEMDDSLAFYGEMLEAGIPGEDARFVMPNATRTNLIMTANLRALIHMSGLRLCTMAQWEIRRLFQLIRHEVFNVSPFLGSFLAPKCVPLGYCDEDRNRDEHCPIRPHKDNVLAAWAEKKAAAKAAGAIFPRSRRHRLLNGAVRDAGAPTFALVLPRRSLGAMPYTKISDLPNQVDQYSTRPKHAFLEAFNDAYMEYGGDESRAFGAAHAAAQRAPGKTQPKEVAPMRPVSPAAEHESLYERPNRGPAASPAASTSSWLTARRSRRRRIRDRETPTSSIPAQRAAMASSTVDMPTASPPHVRSMRTSAGVS